MSFSLHFIVFAVGRTFFLVSYSQTLRVAQMYELQAETASQKSE